MPTEDGFTENKYVEVRLKPGQCSSLHSEAVRVEILVLHDPPHQMLLDFFYEEKTRNHFLFY